MVNFLARLVMARPRQVAIAGTLVGVVGAIFSGLLYQNLHTDIEELLPTTARSVNDLNTLSERMRSFDNLVILVRSNDPGQSKRYVDALAELLHKVPTNTIARVEYRIGEEVKFFRDRRALYLDVSELIRLRDYLRDRIRYEKIVRSPVLLFSPDEFKAPKLDISELGGKRKSDLETFTRFKDGYYATPDEKVRALVVFVPEKGIGGARRMKAAIEECVARLDTKTFAPDLAVSYTGNVENLIEESAALIADLELSTALVMFFVFLAMFLFYRSLWATCALIASLLMGTLWTFGVSYFLVGYLNANTAFLASIVIGNGINFGVIFLARYLEERRKGGLATEAVLEAMLKSAPATGVAALGAGLSYGSLMLTSFRGFSQFGIIGLVGMLLCWLSAYTLLPAYLLVVDRWVVPPKNPRVVKHVWMSSVSRMIDRFCLPICAVAVAATIVSLISFRDYGPDFIETDFSKLRDKRSMTQGSGALYHYINEIFGHSSSPTVILPKSAGDALKIAAVLEEQKKLQGANSVITTVQTLDSFLPTEQPEKIAILKEIRKTLTPQILKYMPAKDRKQITEALNPNAFRTFSQADLPPLLLSRFQEKDKTTGRILFVDKRVDSEKDDAVALSAFINTLRNSADEIQPGTAVAGELAVTYDMFDAITHDGPMVTLFALLVVVLLVIVLFHEFRLVSLALLSLFLGILWFAGVVLVYRLKLNFLNFIALPITFGIGVDYGVNIFQRYREDGPGEILNVVKNAGGAVCLCSLTTIIGYCSLLLAGNQAFVSFGRLAVLGELTCVVAAVIVVPAFLVLRRRYQPSLRRQQTPVLNDRPL